MLVPEEEKEPHEKTELEKKKEIEAINKIYGDPGEGYEWASDVDSEGKQIWGKEGEDFEWYYQEDKESYERGESTVPEILNKNQVGDCFNMKQNEFDRMKMFTAIKAKPALAVDTKPLYKKKKKRTGGGFDIRKDALN